MIVVDDFSFLYQEYVRLRVELSERVCTHFNGDYMDSGWRISVIGKKPFYIRGIYCRDLKNSLVGHDFETKRCLVKMA